jgi:hypothetical protein
VIGAGGALAALVGHNNRLEGRALAILALAMGAPILVVALGGLRAALRLAEDQAGWLLSSLGVTPDGRRAARWLSRAALWLLAAVTYGSIVVAGS